MRRLAGSASTFCSAVSLLLCLAVCALWVRSYGMTDQVLWRRIDGERSIRSAQGRVIMALYLGDRSDRPPEWHGLRYAAGTARPPTELMIRIFLSPDPGDTGGHWERAGFVWSETRNARLGRRTAHAAAPFWGLAAVTATLPLAWTFARWRTRARARRRTRLGLCTTCGYDLRATPTGGAAHGGALLPRCPECGLPAKAPAADPARPGMTRIKLGAAFAAGFAVATAVCFAVVLPLSNQSVRDAMETDVHQPLMDASYYAYLSAVNGDGRTAAAQLLMTIERFNAHRGFHGPAPIHWWKDVANHPRVAPTTRPARP